jgi:hypothetical protein
MNDVTTTFIKKGKVLGHSSRFARLVPRVTTVGFLMRSTKRKGHRKTLVFLLFEQTTEIITTVFLCRLFQFRRFQFRHLLTLDNITFDTVFLEIHHIQFHR